jgi:hypothetical protein
LRNKEIIDRPVYPIFVKNNDMLLFEVGLPEIQGILTVVLFGFIFYLMTELKS